MIGDAWIPEAPPNAPVLAGYMTIENNSRDKRTLVGAGEAPFERIEIHRTLYDQASGLAKMAKADHVDIAPGQTLLFQPGGLHLMMIHPQLAMKAGQQLPVTLQFSQGPGIRVEFEVRRTRLPRYQ